MGSPVELYSTTPWGPAPPHTLNSWTTMQTRNTKGLPCTKRASHASPAQLRASHAAITHHHQRAVSLRTSTGGGDQNTKHRPATQHAGVCHTTQTTHCSSGNVMQTIGTTKHHTGASKNETITLSIQGCYPTLKMFHTTHHAVDVCYHIHSHTL